jgi:hypothetical protein
MSLKFSKETLSLLKTFSTINNNLLFKPGNKISTMAAAKDIMAEVEVAETFNKEGGIFNLPELLGVISLFPSPEIVMEDRFMTIKEGKNKIKYVYADASLLTVPTKSINMPAAEISFTLTSAVLVKIQKASAALSVADLVFRGDGKNIIASVLDAKNPTSNNFDIDLETATGETFEVFFKVDRLKMPVAYDYTVDISSKMISKFHAKDIKLTMWVAVEGTSKFN